MDFLPVLIDIRARDCLVVGGGEVAARKVNLLRRAGGRVTVVAPELCAELAADAAAGELVHRAEAFSAGVFTTSPGFSLAVAATDDAATNAEVATTARAARVPVNVVDDPERCTFIFPSIVDRSPLLVAVSTGGAAPVLARSVRSRIETLLPAGYGRVAEFLRGVRAGVKTKLSAGARRRFYEDLLEGPVPELVLAGRERDAAAAFAQELQAAGGQGTVCGQVSLVGAGPGDPDLLTFRALRLMQRADVVLYDRLVAPAILDLARRDARRIYVGKKRDYHTVRQEEINELLVALAREGRHVVRLKGGDPFVFGRGGEEIATLAAQGIPFQVVPGITAANGCAAYAGIPLTHRDHAHSVLFVTGHLHDGSVDLDWPALVRPAQTVVIYMGLTALGLICAGLIRHGMRADMPAALIEQGTTQAHRVLIGTLESLPARVVSEEVRAPTLLIVGEVVSLNRQLAWFEAGRQGRTPD